MNIERLNAVIATLEKEEHLDNVRMRWFQSRSDNNMVTASGGVKTEAEFHSCGNSACLGGRIALMPLFQETVIPGQGRFSMDNYMSPVFVHDRDQEESSSQRALSMWLELPTALVKVLIYNASEGDDYNEDHAVYGAPWPEVRVGHVLKVLRELRDVGPLAFMETILSKVLGKDATQSLIDDRDNEYDFVNELYRCVQRLKAGA